MALYKYPNYLSQNHHAEFDAEYPPGSHPSNSGIYRCSGCGDEIAANKNQPLPPQNHHQHQNVLPIRWKLIVCAVQR